MSFIPVKTLGQYQIGEQIGFSNDIVYRAFDPVCNRIVAVKEAVFKDGATQEDRLEKLARFQRECQATGALSHPNIMAVYSAGEDNGTYYLVLEYLDGKPLSERLKNKNTFGYAELLEIISPVLEALEHVHGQGIIHRDLKPDNIIILKSGIPKIIDFGIARITYQDNLTVDGQVFGTPSGMAPEQIRGVQIDHRVDLYAVGVIIYEMIAGEKPFTSSDPDPNQRPFQIAYKVINTEPDFPATTFTSQEMVCFLKKCLAKDPINRFDSAREQLEALKEIVSKQLQPINQPHPKPSIAAVQHVPAGGQIIMPGSGLGNQTPVGGVGHTSLLTQPPTAPNQYIGTVPTAGSPVRGSYGNPNGSQSTSNHDIWKRFPVIAGIVGASALVLPILSPLTRFLLGFALVSLSLYWLLHPITRHKKLLPDLSSKILLIFVGSLMVVLNRYVLIQDRSFSNNSSRFQPVEQKNASSTSHPTHPNRKERPKAKNSSGLGSGKDKVASQDKKLKRESVNQVVSKRSNESDDDKPLRSPGSDGTGEPNSTSGSKSDTDDDPPLRGGD